MFEFLAALPKVAYFVRGALVQVLILLAGGRCGTRLRVERGLRLRQGFHSGLSFGKGVYFGRNITIDCLRGAKFELGDNVTLTEGIFVSSRTGVKIGESALIGEYSSIRDANHEFADPERPISEQPMPSKQVTIGAGAWVGRGCAILSGVEIGPGAVIGANSVVTRSIPAGAIAFGAPARVKGSRPGY